MPTVGYFAWMRTQRGEPTPQKLHKDTYEVNNKETKNYYNRVVLKIYPLDEAEWFLSLKDLSEKYPAPEVTSK